MRKGVTVYIHYVHVCAAHAHLMHLCLHVLMYACTIAVEYICVYMYMTFQQCVVYLHVRYTYMYCRALVITVITMQILYVHSPHCTSTEDYNIKAKHTSPHHCYI